MEFESGDNDVWDDEEDNYNNGIYIDTENLPVMRLLTPYDAECCGIYGRPTARVVKISMSKSNDLAKIMDTGHDEDYYTQPDFIYGGPFIPVKLPSPFIDAATPMNVPLQGTFKKSFAYYSLKERVPVILTKLIDYLAREGSTIKKVHSANDADLRCFMKTVTKLKNDLVTNKDYDLLDMDTPDAVKWNNWIESQDIKKYFLNSWMFTECYIYRKLKDGCEITKSLKDFDYFEEQKNKAFESNEEIMCLVADRMVTMIKESEKDKRKADFVTLLKICLWANKCDMSLSVGSQTNLIQMTSDLQEKLRKNPPPLPPPKGKNKPKKGKPAAEPPPITLSPDPFQMVVDLKDKVIVDDCNKIADQIVSKADALAQKIQTQQSAPFKAKCSCNRLAKKAGVPICQEPQPPPVPEAGETPKEEATKEEEAKDDSKKIPCPAKMVVPQSVFFDIVCDNAGYELFADLCLAHFLIAQKIVAKVRFHVKNMPWFVSDVTLKDFQFVINSCANSQFNAQSSTGLTEEDTGTPKMITAENLRSLGEEWKKFYETGVFLVMADDFWTYPYCFKDMKAMDPNLYRKLQTGVSIMFKGDLNYRKLLGDMYINPYNKFQPSLQGFIPAPIIAVRTVKSETICGMPKGKFEAITAYDEKWMQTGDYGLIQYCPKGEKMKVSDQPCVDYCKTCFGVICPEHDDL